MELGKTNHARQVKKRIGQEDANNEILCASCMVPVFREKLVGKNNPYCAVKVVLPPLSSALYCHKSAAPAFRQCTVEIPEYIVLIRCVLSTQRDCSVERVKQYRYTAVLA